MMLIQDERVIANAANASTLFASQVAIKTEVYELSQRFYFEAAHTLNRVIETESSRRIHGHTYEAEITLRGVPKDSDGMICDLGYIRREINRVRDMLDHRFLDDVADLEFATLEGLCKFIQKHLMSSIPQLCSVMVERRISGDRCVLRW
jgi:6-pyruvoyltetrahydropterin/6-carboxytetrahydropterin synthase